ncbi:MAG: uroporphyrinogen-III synthase [Flavobacteriia bacterium]
MIKSLYISRSEEDVPLLLNFCSEQGIELESKSMISFVGLDFIVEESFDVVFFSSPRSVQYFLEKYNLSDQIFMGCIGHSTAEELAKWGFDSSFIGENSGHPEQVAEAFKNWLGKRKVLFPISMSSNKTFTSQIPFEQKLEITVYQTIYTPQIIEEANLYVFTSPSNLKAFLSVNEVPKAPVIAWGNTTAKAISNAGMKLIHVLESATEEELVSFLANG